MIDYVAVGGNANCFWSRCQLLWSCKNLVWRQWWRGGDSGATIFSYHHFLHLLHWSVSQSSQSNQRHSWIQGVLSLQGESNVFGSPCIWWNFTDSENGHPVYFRIMIMIGFWITEMLVCVSYMLCDTRSSTWTCLSRPWVRWKLKMKRNHQRNSC